ncbi:ATP-binding protein [Aliiglaciecola sp. CAU 1673]|uniref:sensor histidine kinase n=1 Tax=Aliiglaciecola sp. CAU 1673 TaxID=3032595 RepID=UPI0023DB5F40|nr:ATP-binding protein [Aliiglaciecola sp. CAU 1673]MDF2177954.1 ATP-binding protein [Aliiglaciecola sp. CAU 1673]
MKEWLTASSRMPGRWHQNLPHWLVFSFIYLILATAVGALAHRQAEKLIEDSATKALSELSSKLEIELDKFRTLPKVLTLHPAIESALLWQTPTTIDTANKLLSRYNASLLTDAVYLLNQDGVTLASSNWDAADSFVGSNYGFRPYFQEAMSGNPGSYFALGTVSGRRGYYFSNPVYVNGEVRGVLVIKVALSALENDWPQSDFDFLLTDIYGVVFFSSQPDWNYKTLAELDTSVERQLRSQMQYGGISILPLTEAIDIQQVLESRYLNISHQASQGSYRQVHQDMSPIGWRLFALAPAGMTTQYVLWSLVLFTLFFSLVYLISFSWRKTADARRALAAINEQLEQLVEGRTMELRQSNAQLIEIIEKYKQTELTLKRTQNELIQAGKLAMLGEMSASINHELNQPLAAMRIYTENLPLLAKREDLRSIESNAQEILKLNKMMAKIIGQYKLFARKSAGKLGPVSLAETLSASLAILDNKIQRTGAQVVLVGNGEQVQVMADAVPLEQVIINLLNNALQATSNVPHPRIKIDVLEHSGKVLLSVEDNGPGFSDEELERVFEPFYTTKGQGLGLGLTISKRIVESFGGEIIAENLSQGGAKFVVSLIRNTTQD